MHARGIVLVVLLVFAGCYEAPTGNARCSITCTSACPGELACTNGFCVGPGEMCAPEFVQASAGGGFACAIDNLGALWCWGANDRHQIDASDELVRPLAVRIGTEQWESISSGGGHACGISDGRILCWGANDRGQIAGTITGDVKQPIEIVISGGPARWTAVVAGFNATCAIGDGRLYCWGAGDVGQLGAGTTTDIGSPSPVKTMLADWTAVSLGWGAGRGHTCAISTSTGLWCWGDDTYGQLGATTLASTTEPVHIDLPGTPASIASAGYSTCATNDAGELYCWGYSPDHALGDPMSIDPATTTYVYTPTLASPTVGWTKLSSSEELVCGLHTGEVWCWGFSATGLYFGDGAWHRGGGFGLVAGGATDVTVGSNLHIDVDKVVTGELDTACYIGNGAVRCWGDNRYGQLGQGGATMSARPVEIAEARIWTTLAAGAQHACATDDQGEVACWGSTLAGAVDGIVAGTLTTPCQTAQCDRGSPLDVRPGNAVAVGDAHTCALDGDQIFCWGDDGYNQLGTGVVPATQIQVPGVWTDLFDVHGNGQCARGNGETQCWGNIVNGTLLPTHVAELDTMRSISATGIISPGYPGFGCYLDDNRQLACFGGNALGQFGNGPFLPTATCGDLVCDANECESCPSDCTSCPVACGNAICDAGETSDTCGDCGTAPMSHLGRTYQAISLGWDIDQDGAFACGVRLDGGVECWGRNRGAMISTEIVPSLGTPPANVPVPTQIAGLAACTAVAAGRSHACAICGDVVSCWGDNARGAVGSGVLTSKTVTTPRPIEIVLDPGDRFVQIVAGLGFSCARTEAGHVVCWGADPHGALGTGATSSTLPIVVRPE